MFSLCLYAKDKKNIILLTEQIITGNYFQNTWYHSNLKENKTFK
jgi:hypothetical protein